VREQLRKLTGESVVYGLGTAAGRGLQMLLVPVFTRVFAPEAYGVIDLLGLVGSIAALLVVMGTDAALARFFYDAADSEARRVMISSSALWRVGVCSVVALTLWMLAPAFSVFLLGSGDYAKYVRLTALAIPFTAFFMFQNDVLRVTFQPWKFISLNLVNTILVGGLSILFVVVWKKGVAGVLYGRLFGDAITAAFGFVLIRLQLVPRFDRIVLRRMLAYGAPLIPVAIAYWVMQYADRWTLAHFRDLATVGIYAVAVKMGAAMMLVVSAFHLAWGPFAFARARDPGAARLFSRVLTLYVAVAATFALLLGLFAAEALGVLVPGAYARAALPGGLLCFAAVAHGAYYIVALGANLSFRTDLLAWTSLVAAAVNVALNFLLVQAIGIRGVSTATLVGFALSTALLYTLAQKVHPIPFRGLRASALFLVGIGTLLAGVLGGQALAAAWGAAASIGLRIALLLGYAGLAAFLARRMAPPWDGPLASAGDAIVPVDFTEERA
jgi:O-antigen/teichoic acid export membrane protein